MTDMTAKNNDIKYELVAEAGAECPSEPPLRMMRRSLRGRYRLAILLVALLATIGGFIGYHAVPPKYVSTGFVRIDGALPTILYESQENQVPPMFDAYIAAQVTYLRGRQVLDVAMTLPHMQEAGWPAGPEGIAQLQRTLTVRRGRGEQVISVSVTHDDPRLAQAAVNAVLAAYKQSSADPGGLTLSQKEQALVEREKDLEQQLQQLREGILEISDQYGHQAIERMHADKVEQLVAIYEKLAELRLGRSKPEVGEYPDESKPLSMAFLPGANLQLSGLKEQELALLAEIESLQTKYRPNHPIIRELALQLEAVRIRMDLRERALADLTIGIDHDTADHPTVAETAGDRPSQLEARYETMRELVREETARLRVQRLALTDLNERVAEIKDRLAETRRRLDELRVEANRGNVNRISIAAYGDLPVAPASDRRRGLAAAGVLFGGIAGGAIIFLIGLVDPRARYVEELEVLGESAPVIALLPDLDSGDDASEQQAARSVHQLRNLLELQCGDPNTNVHAITSCSRGEGKTSLALALGASFAAAGRKTLLIDADVARCSLTHELGLGNVAGLCEAMDPGNGSGQIHQTSTQNLWAMPIGSTRALDPENLSRSKLVFLLNALRSRFDAIIIDSGPMLTSVEACLMCAVSDRVVLVVGRNQKVGLVRSSVFRLEQVHANCVGVVFNRAATSEFKVGEGVALDEPTRIATLVASAPTSDDECVGPLSISTNKPPSARPDAPYTRKRAA